MTDTAPDEAEVRYGVVDQEWTQSFTARLLDEAALRALRARRPRVRALV